MGYFKTKLIVEQVSATKADDRGLWRLIGPLIFWSDKVDRLLYVPSGFCTDFASVPRLIVAFALVGDTAQEAATVHDFLYSRHLLTRRMSDAVLLEACKATGIPWYRRWPMWVGVRLFGWSHW